MTDQQATGHPPVDHSDVHRLNGPARVPAQEASTAELVRLAAEQISRLVRDELQLARLEMSVKAKRFGTGAGLFGAAGFVALYGVAALLATLVLLLALVMPAWLAALIVAVVLFAVAGVMALLGRGQFRRATPAAPEQTLDNLKADVQTVTDAVRKRGH
jgi:putative superfamily III holin-X